MLIEVFVILIGLGTAFTLAAFLNAFQMRIFMSSFAVMFWFVLALSILSLSFLDSTNTNSGRSIVESSGGGTDFVYVTGNDNVNGTWIIQKRNGDTGVLVWSAIVNPAYSKVVDWRNDFPIAYLFMGLGVLMIVRTVQLILEWLAERRQAQVEFEQEPDELPKL